MAFTLVCLGIIKNMNIVYYSHANDVDIALNTEVGLSFGRNTHRYCTVFHQGKFRYVIHLNQ
jgi:hypothetical protein